MLTSSGSRATALGCALLVFACGPGELGFDDSGFSAQDSAGDPAECIFAPVAVSFELVNAAPTSDTVIEQVRVVASAPEEDDPGRWTFVFEPTESGSEIELEFWSTPPLLQVPFAVDDELTIAHARVVEEGVPVWVFLDLYGGGGSERLMSLRSLRGPPAFNQDDQVGPFYLDWIPAPNCSYSVSMCEQAEALDVAVSSFPDVPVAQLGPSERHTDFELTYDGEEYAYELWLGDTWAGTCGGAAVMATRSAVVRKK